VFDSPLKAVYTYIAKLHERKKMSRLIKVNHVVLTLKISPAGGGETQYDIDKKVNDRLAEGYDEVQIFPVKTNFAERGDPTDLVQLYVFKQYEKEAVKSKKSDV
jgi:hypothetical protein